MLSLSLQEETQNRFQATLSRFLTPTQNVSLFSSSLLLFFSSSFIEERSLELRERNRSESNTEVLRFLKKRLASRVTFDFGGAVRKRASRFGRFISGMSTISVVPSSEQSSFAFLRLGIEQRSLTDQLGLILLLLIVTSLASRRRSSK